jgi:hypothetical protein
MKRAVLALFPVLAVAQQMPPIMGYLPNRDNNKITFTTFQGECKQGNRVAYTQADGGKISEVGCYRLVGDEIFVVWAEGDVYTYPLGSVTLSSEMEAFLNRQQ